MNQIQPSLPCFKDEEIEVLKAAWSSQDDTSGLHKDGDSRNSVLDLFCSLQMASFSWPVVW